MKTYGGAKLYLRAFLTSALDRGGQLRAQATLSRGKELPEPIGQEAGGDPEPVWTRWQREYIPAPAGNRTPVVQPTAQSLYWLSYAGSLVAGINPKPTDCVLSVCMFLPYHLTSFVSEHVV
jgi:hypothetical protein